jgi:hypothetical protein
MFPGTAIMAAGVNGSEKITPSLRLRRLADGMQLANAHPKTQTTTQQARQLHIPRLQQNLNVS